MRITSILFLILILSGCKKSELVTVTGNQAPPDGTIQSVIVENYINRSYILVLGREPSASELLTSKSSLLGNNLDSVSRMQFLSVLTNAPDYLPHLYELNKIDLLNNVDTVEFLNFIAIFDFYLQDTTYAFQWPFLTVEKDRLVQMLNGYSQFITGTISLAELQRRMCNNYVYDQINMGTSNFVLSTFSLLINRNPTRSELTSGISMADGNNAILFLTAGNSKNDYLTILTGGNNYFEGQVARLYIRFLNRDPDTNEMVDATNLYATTGQYSSVLKKILSTNEFIGL